VGAGNGALAGNVRFELFANDACTGTALYDSGNLPVAGGTGTGTSRTVTSDNKTAYTTSMVFSWRVTFTSTNSGHDGVTSICDDEHSELMIDNDYLP
jgi:hypothetical protein